MDAIYVDRIKDIPKDYFRLMAVPITIFHYHYQDLFRVIGTTRLEKDLGLARRPLVNGKAPFSRIIIQRK